MAEKRWDTIQIIDSVALSAPAVRMAVVYGGWGINEDNGEEEPWSGFVPVLAIQAAVRRTYSRRHQERMADYATTRALEADGWNGEESAIIHDFLVMDPTGNAYGFCEASAAFDMRGVHYEPVACTWPPDEDAAMLAPMMELAVRKAKGWEMARLAREKQQATAGVKGG